MALAGLILGGLAIYVAGERVGRSTLPVIGALAFGSWWALGVVVEFALAGPSLAYLLVMLKPFAMMGLVSCLVILAIEHTGSLSFVKRKHYFALLIIPAITMLLSIAGESTHLYRFHFRSRPHGLLHPLTWDGGPWQSLVNAYEIGLATLASVLVLRAALHAQKGYRRTVLVTGASWLLPMVGDVSSALGLTSKEANVSAWAMLAASLWTAWALLSQRVFSVGPIARGLIVEQMSDLLSVLDGEGRLADCNVRAQKVLGLPHGTWRNLVPGELPAPWNEILESESAPTTQVNVSFPGSVRGEVRVYERRQTPLFDRRNSRVGRAILLHDISHLETMRAQLMERNEELAAANESLLLEISQRRAAERRLAEAERMETVGRLAGGIAHDFNNLLTVINGYSSLLVARMECDERNKNYILQVQKAGERATELTQQLLAFSRKQTIQPTVLDLNRVIGEANEMLGRLLPENIRMVAELDVDLHPVLADPGQFHQVLMNLSANARDAMPDGGRLTVTTSNVEVDAEFAATHPDITPGNYVLMEVTDTGVGMDEQALARVFEPFFSTKAAGRGTGLGLSMVYGIVRQSGGWIWVDSEPGRGTSFRIYLPRTTRTPEGAAVAAAALESLRGTETVLVVEDQDQVRNLVRDVLRGYGYRVLEAADGEAAMELAGQFREPIHLLLSDVVMPGMTGGELARQLCPLRRDMKVLFMSGYADDVIVRKGVLEDGVAHIQKPMTPEALGARVREVLGRQAPAMMPVG